jgi:hypothetical protein
MTSERAVEMGVIDAIMTAPQKDAVRGNGLKSNV